MLLKMLFFLLSPLFRLVRRFEGAIVNRVYGKYVVDESRLASAAEKAWNNKGDIVAIEGTPFQVHVFESAIYPGEYMFEFGEPGGATKDTLYDFGFAKSPEEIVEHIVWLLS